MKKQLFAAAFISTLAVGGVAGATSLHSDHQNDHQKCEKGEVVMVSRRCREEDHQVPSPESPPAPVPAPTPVTPEVPVEPVTTPQTAPTAVTEPVVETTTTVTMK